MSVFRGSGGIGSGSITTIPIQVAEGGTSATNAADARTNLGLGSIATQNTDSIAITGGAITGITDIAIADGGTGASTAQEARNNLLPTQTSESGKYLKTDGTDVSWDQIDISSGDVTGTLPVVSGGTGATSAANARTNLLPSYSGNGSKVLALNAGATDVEWVTSGSAGTVTSVGLTVPTGLTVTGSPVTSSGNIDIAFDTGYSIPTTVKQGNWDDAYTFVGNFPSQTSNSGKYLTTDGSTLSWATVAGGNVVDDTTPQLGGALDTNGYAINFGDNDKATFGDSEDLWLYHDGGTSYLFDRGTGNLRIVTNSTVSIDGVSGGEFMAQFVSNGAVSLYYDNSNKFQTTSTGVNVTGNIAVSGTVDGVDIAAGATNWDTAYGWGNHASAGYLDSADIGVSVQGYDADTAKYDDVTANFTGTLQNGGNTVLTTASTIEGGTY